MNKLQTPAMHSNASQQRATPEAVGRLRPIRLLLVSDRESDFDLFHRLLSGSEEGEYALEWVTTFEDALHAGASKNHDIVISDSTLDGKDALELAHSLDLIGTRVPVVLLLDSGNAGVDPTRLKSASIEFFKRDAVSFQVFELVISHAISSRKLRAENAIALGLLAQAQRMEAVGQLARGVAHDFNNLLTAILCYADLGAAMLPKGDCNLANLKEIQKAAQRAAGLTRQLLAFSKKQNVEREAMDLNELLMDSHPVLKRFLGNSIELVTLPSSEPAVVFGDAGQIEQVVFNLAMNARDSMPNGGKLVFQSRRVLLKQEEAVSAGLPEGSYIEIKVADNGAGMNAETKARVFDPPFTERDTGLRLSLSTCLNLVMQNGGNILVESESQVGTTFRIFLPVAESSAFPAATFDILEGSERVLLVDDDETVRSVAATALRAKGYAVSEAGNGTDALRVGLRSTDGPFDILVTDIVMPLMSGKELADRLRASFSSIKVLYTSGYTDLSVSSEGNAGFIAKPFAIDSLALKVRQTLDAV